MNKTGNYALPQLCELAVELCFRGASADVLERLQETLPDNFVYEDLSARGWGPSVVRVENWVGDRKHLSELIISLFASLAHVVDAYAHAHQARPLLRLGIFHQTFTFTFALSSEAAACLTTAGAELMATLYPSSDEGELSGLAEAGDEKINKE